MTKMWKVLIAAGALLFNLACVHLSPVSLDATPGDYEMLVGTWEGQYESTALGRSGSIEFQLVAGEAQAHGNVLMIPAGWGRSYDQYNDPETQNSTTADHPLSRVLTIRFVGSQGGTVTGRLDPYWDPDRECQASTVFVGYLKPGSIEGTFTTDFATGFHPQVAGTWAVTRKPNSKK